MAVVFQEVNIHTYLDEIQSAIRSCHPDFLVAKISEEYQKPMIRTLLDLKDKVTFDAALRNLQKELEFQALKEFYQKKLVPRLQQDSNNKLLIQRIEQALAVPPSAGSQAFRKIATGPVYRGDAVAMIKAIAPDLEHHYMNAITTATSSNNEHHPEQPVLQALIDSQRDLVDPTRIQAAQQVLTSNEFLKLDVHTETWKPSRSSGKHCEQECLEFLRQQQQQQQLGSCSSSNYPASSLVLHNVNVSALSSKKKNDNRLASSNNTLLRRTTSSSRIGRIWTSTDRDRACSELDALVLHSNKQNASYSIAEIWEAKHSIGPSTLIDAIAKKLLASRNIVHDKDAFLSLYHCNTDHPQDQLDEIQVSMIPPHDDDTTQAEDPLVFGIFGLRLLPPRNAVNQLKSMTVGSLLGKDVDVVLQAIESGFVVQVDRQKILQDIHELREHFDQAMHEFQIRLVVRQEVEEDTNKHEEHDRDDSDP